MNTWDQLDSARLQIRGMREVAKAQVEGIQNALTLLETKGYRMGDIHDDLQDALDQVRAIARGYGWETPEDQAKRREERL